MAGLSSVKDYSTRLKADALAATSTGGAPTHRRSSSSMNNSTATMRVSVSDIVNTHGKERHAAEKSRQEAADAVRKQRRKSSLLQMGVANSAIRDAASNVLKQEAASAADATGTSSAVEKLQALLTRAKEKGMSAERLFEHFAPNGESSVTPAMFEVALRNLGQRAFNLDEVELEHIVTTFDTDGNGTIELDEFMTFCLSIPSLPWRAEKVRRLNNADSKDELSVAARKVARRRSSLRAIPIGKLIHEGSRFFWRSKETIDVAYHFNSDEGLITISTRSPERGYNYPAIFVDSSKIPVSKSDAVDRANSVGQFDALTEEEQKEAVEKSMSTLRVEYLQHRLKVPDEVNGPETEADTTEQDASSTSSEEEEGKSGGGTPKEAVLETGTVVVPSGGAVSTAREGGMGPKERADDKAKHRPFLAKMSTDNCDGLLCSRNIVLQTPHRFEGAGRRSSMDDFRRTSFEFGKLAKETEALSSVAEKNARTLDAAIDSIAAAKKGM